MFVIESGYTGMPASDVEFQTEQDAINACMELPATDPEGEPAAYFVVPAEDKAWWAEAITV